MAIIEDPTRTLYDLSVLHQESVDAYARYIGKRSELSQKEKNSLLSGLVNLSSEDELAERTETATEKVFATASSLWTESLIRGLERPRPESGGIEFQRRDQYKSSGSMYLFSYNPLTKQKMSYYDTFPLVLVTNVTDTKFFGVNLHYVPPRQRLFLIGKILRNFNPRMEDSFKGIDFGYLNTKEGSAIVRPCYRSYFDQRISSINIMSIGPEDWMTAARMPLERFRKVSRESVWGDIRRKQING